MKAKFWKSEGWRSFWLAFFLTLLVMLPGMVIIWAKGGPETDPTPVAERKSGIPIRLPDERHQTTILAVVTGEEPAFMLVRLDAVEGRFALGAIPAQSVVRSGTGSQTLAECYQTAGPARAARLLTETLALPIDRYLAATPETWQAILEELGPVRVGLNGVLTAEQRKAAGLDEDAQSWTVTGAHRFLQHLTEMHSPLLPPPSYGLVRATLWQGWAWQKLDQLPSVLPAGLKKHSSKLLTDLTATELLSLEETLEFLADSQLQPAAGVLPGHWNASSCRYEFEEETLDWLQAFFNREASAGASDSANEP